MKANFEKGTKICSKCRLEQNITKFSYNKTENDGLYRWCKSCQYVSNNAWRQKNRSRPTVDPPSSRECSKCHIVKPASQFAKSLSSKLGLTSWCRACKATEDTKPTNRSRRSKHAMTRHKTPEGHKYKIDNKTKRVKERCETDPVFKFKCHVRQLLRDSFKRCGFHKNTRGEKMLGCSYEEFRQHMVSKSQPNWTIENHGAIWHIDHIVPLATAKTVEDVIRLCHYTNLQPLSGPDNLKKGAKLDWKK